MGGWQESVANLALPDVVEATVGQRRVLSATREAYASNVLGQLVQTTAGKWITHPPSQCPNGPPPRAGIKSWSVTSPALDTAAATPPGRAAHAMKRCMGRRSTRTARRW